jgi:hypothetical protein
MVREFVQDRGSRRVFYVGECVGNRFPVKSCSRRFAARG